MALEAVGFMTLLRRHRLAKGMSQTQLGKLVKRSPAAVSSWERGEFLPDAEVFPKLARALDIDPMELTRVISPLPTPTPIQS